MSRHHHRYTAAEKRLIWAYKASKGFKCEVCGSGYKVQAHHKVPLNRGGKTVAENLEARCFDCHRKAHRELRGSKPGNPWFEFVADRARGVC